MTENIEGIIKAAVEKVEDLNKSHDDKAACKLECPKAICCFNICKSIVVVTCEKNLKKHVL